MADFKKLKDGQGNFYNVKDETARTNLASHTGNTSNPHSVTKAQVGLGNVDNTSDANKPISNAQAAVNATKFDKANVKAMPASIPSNDNVVSEKYSEETYAKKDGYYETFGYAREAGIASNLKNDEGKLLDPDTATSSGTVYADQPFTQRATAMTMNAYLNNELISVGSGYEQWKKEQAFSIVRNQLLTATKAQTLSGVSFSVSGQHIVMTGTATASYNFEVNTIPVIQGHKYICLVNAIKRSVSPMSELPFWQLYSENPYISISVNETDPQPNKIFTASADATLNLRIRIENNSTYDYDFYYYLIDLTKWFASRPEIATALNGDAGIKWFLQNYPQATTLGYDEGTIVDTEDYEYQTTGVNLFAGNSVSNPQYIGHYYQNPENVGWSIDINNNYNCYVLDVFPSTQYRIHRFDGNNFTATGIIAFLTIDDNVIGGNSSGYNSNDAIFTTPNNCAKIRFSMPISLSSEAIQICNHFTETTVEQTYHPSEIYKNRVSWAFTSTGKGKSAGKVADTKDYVNKKNIEKVGRVDLGTLDWSKLNSRFHTALDNTKLGANNVICSKYTYDSGAYSETVDKTYYAYNGTFYINDTSYTDVATFKAAMSGVYLNYELATPIETDMTGDELDTNIPENDYGVERKVPLSGNMFSGSSTTIFYQDNVLRQIYNNKTSIDNLQEELNTIEARIPTAPTTDGTYTLKAVVSNGVVTYSWTLDSQGV